MSGGGVIDERVKRGSTMAKKLFVNGGRRWTSESERG